MVHSRAGLAHIGEANAEFQQARKFMRFISARRDVDLVDRAPKAIAGMRVVMTHIGGSLAGGGADEGPGAGEAEVGQEVFPPRAYPFLKVERCRRGMAGSCNSRSKKYFSL